MKKHVLKCGLSFMLLLMATAMMAQFRVSGSVKDEAGEALVGASVVVKGTTIGTLTDIDGKFAFDVPGKSATLSITFVGYAGQDKAVQMLQTLFVNH